MCKRWKIEKISQNTRIPYDFSKAIGIPTKFGMPCDFQPSIVNFFNTNLAMDFGIPKIQKTIWPEFTLPEQMFQMIHLI